VQVQVWSFLHEVNAKDIRKAAASKLVIFFIYARFYGKNTHVAPYLQIPFLSFAFCSSGCRNCYHFFAAVFVYLAQQQWV